ncbi:hypothetical protein [Verminephrobacter eiseniae]
MAAQRFAIHCARPGCGRSVWQQVAEIGDASRATLHNDHIQPKPVENVQHLVELHAALAPLKLANEAIAGLAKPGQFSLRQALRLATFGKQPTDIGSRPYIPDRYFFRIHSLPLI